LGLHPAARQSALGHYAPANPPRQEQDIKIKKPLDAPSLCVLESLSLGPQKQGGASNGNPNFGWID